VMYGQTEATARLSCISPRERHAHPGSVGRGLAHTRLEVRDEDGGLAPVGTVGEIVATGPSITQGYWRNPEATARIFGNGGLHTGDLAWMDEDGFLYIVDRARDFLKCGGKRVSCRQIEEVALMFEGMAECAVVGVPDMVLGEAVCLYAVHERGAEAADDLRKHCEKNLDRTLHPKRVVFLDDLPRNKSGKPDKQALKKRAAREIEAEA
ncbi:AMP-dependent synthetase, partial [bacterium DOLJORAL78_65_58]